MHHMSFALTTDAIRARTKTVTRRRAWWGLQPGQLLQAVVKGQGLRKGEHVQKLAVIRVVSVRSERLDALIHDTSYGLAECAKEGYADHPDLRWPDRFAAHFAAANNCALTDYVNRIEFEYVE